MKKSNDQILNLSVPAGWILTGEFRAPKSSEHFLSRNNHNQIVVCSCAGDRPANVPSPIVRPFARIPLDERDFLAGRVEWLRSDDCLPCRVDVVDTDSDRVHFGRCEEVSFDDLMSGWEYFDKEVGDWRPCWKEIDFA